MRLFHWKLRIGVPVAQSGRKYMYAQRVSIIQGFPNIIHDIINAFTLDLLQALIGCALTSRNWDHAGPEKAIIGAIECFLSTIII